MTKRRVLAIGLDGYEASLGDRWIAEGRLPHLARLEREAARFDLDHGPAQRTGLAWEHVATGRSPEDAGRFAAVSFDPATYACWQEGTRRPPFVADGTFRTIVFDAPYFDLARAPSTEGLVDWGAHDPGVAPQGRPDGLLRAFGERFGDYPARHWLYGLPWPSPRRAAAMGEALAEAARLRARAATWLLGERLPAWDLALVVASEAHSAIEGLWHGVDDAHPLAEHPSAAPAGEGLLAVYRALDDLVGTLRERFPDAALIVFAMGGMGPNRSDVASMVLLPELLFREAFGRARLSVPEAWRRALPRPPLLGEDASWSEVVHACLARGGAGFLARLRRALRRRLDARVASSASPADASGGGPAPLRLPLRWMPAARYADAWSRMDAFTLPSFYDGRVRVNLKERERHGRVAPADHDRFLDRLEADLRAIRDPATGEGVVDFVERPAGGRDPRTLGPTEADLVVVWRGAFAFDHPRHGLVGPVPLRRTGGHTGERGVAWLSGTPLARGAHGTRSAFDVVPTLLELCAGPAAATKVSGRSLLGA